MGEVVSHLRTKRAADRRRRLIGRGDDGFVEKRHFEACSSSGEPSLAHGAVLCSEVGKAGKRGIRLWWGQHGMTPSV